MPIDLDKHATAWGFANRNAAAPTKKDDDPSHVAAFSDTLYNDVVMGVWKI